MNKQDFVYTGRDNLEAMAEAKNYNRYLVDLVEKTIPGPTAKILDFGAGSGTYADMLKERGYTVECLEPDGVLQAVLKSKGYKVINNADQLQPSNYDVIYTLNVFEHIEDDSASFAILYKTLKKGGRLLIYVPAFQCLFSSMDKLVGHHRRYRTKRLSDMAKANAMKVERLYYCDPIGFFAALVFKASGNKKGELSPTAVRLYDKIAFPISRLFEPLLKPVLGKNAVMIAQKNGK